jgi:Tol biopolymer transport system component
MTDKVSCAPYTGSCVRPEQGRAWKCLVLFVSWVLSAMIIGCAGREHFFDVTGDLVVLSAADHYEEALERAKEWKEDAYLSRISADVGAWTGDGRLVPSLTYMFHSPTTPDAFYILRLSDGVWSSEEAEQGRGPLKPAPVDPEDWSLDSTDAWSIALANGGEQFLLQYQDPMTIMSVTLDYWRAGITQGGLAWRVHYLILYGPSLDMIIDPKTGDIIESEERSMSGTLVATTPTLPPTPRAPLPACTPATPKAAQATGLPERIAFESSRDGVTHIYLMDPDGSNMVQLTEGPGTESDAAWSPDGRRIAFTGWRGTTLDIYVMDADRANLERLTHHPGYDREPTWSPDGSRIAFSSDRDGNYNLYVMDADGSHLAQLTDHPLANERPDWSPDGCRIAFSSDRGHTPVFHIYVVNVDGSDVEQLTDGPTTDYQPRWSPDGSKIAFWSVSVSGSEGGPGIYVMDQDGSNRVRLTSGPCAASELVSYPDLRRIALWSLPTTQSLARQDSRVTSRDVLGRLPLRGGPCYGSAPVWSPDGTQIVFAMGRDALGSDIFLMDADGSNVVQLTNEPGYNTPCSWRP